MMQTKIPKAVKTKGNIKFWRYMAESREVPSYANNVLEEMTKAAQVDSAKEPKRSAPIPAISPTLSPTLSAIVAGFFGES